MKIKGLSSILFACMAVALVVSSAEAQTRILSPRSHASIRILSPAKGESLVLGKNYPIRWKAADGVGTLSIALFRNNKFVGTIAKSYPAGKSRYLWPVGRLVKGRTKAGGGYTIGIRSTDGKVKVISPGPFSLKSASSAAGSKQSKVMSGSKTTANLPASTSSGSSVASAPISTHTSPAGSIPQSGMTLQGAPVAKDSFVQRVVDLHFTNPEAGVIWEKGRAYDISWDKAGGIGSVKIRLNDLLNNTSQWVSQGQDHVISNTGTYRYTVPATLSDSAFEMQIMTPDGSYTNKSKRFYIGRRDTDLFVRGANIGINHTWRKWPFSENYYVKAQIWLKNKGTRDLNSVKVAWQVVKEPLGQNIVQGEEIFTNMHPDTWYNKQLSLKYYHGQVDAIGHTYDHIWGKLQEGERYVLKFKADPGNTLGEMELVLGNNTYQTEVLTPETYQPQNK